MYNQSVKQAKAATVFVINQNGAVVETNLYDHVVDSAEKTTSPRGVMTKLFFEQDMVTQLDNDLNEDVEIEKWVLKMWGVGGRGPVQVIATFETEEEAHDDWYTRTYNYDFLPDDQRDTSYYPTLEDAEKHLAELYPNPETEE